MTGLDNQGVKGHQILSKMWKTGYRNNTVNKIGKEDVHIKSFQKIVLDVGKQ
jgi:hypothetical protein